MKLREQVRLAHRERLLGELETCRNTQPERLASYERVLTAARMLLEVPLVHGCERRDALESIAREQALLSREARGQPPHEAELLLGIQDRVYAAMGILYPDKAVALVLNPHVEVNGTAASPWDSGAFAKAMAGNGFSAVESRNCFDEYSLEAPWHREYLVAYVASCYWQASDYLDVSSRHAFSDPLGMLDTRHPRLRTFEVRVPATIPVRKETLLAIFLRQGSLPLPLALSEWLERLDRSGVAVRLFRRGSSQFLEEKVREWISARAGLL